MPEDFNPYHRWLGISPKDLPPNHYRLLGIDLFESDPDVIDAAASKQVTYLQTCATGPHVALSQKILNEVAAARLCLLSPMKKAEYDATLRAELAKKQAVPVSTAQQNHFEGIVQSELPPPSVAWPSSRKKKPSWQIPAGIAVGVALVIGIVGWLVYNGSGGDKKIAQSMDASEKTVTDLPGSKPASPSQTQPSLVPEQLPPSAAATPQPARPPSRIQPSASSVRDDGQVINLLEKIIPARDIIKGNWRQDGEELMMTDGRPWSVLTIPCSPPEEYTLTATVERKNGTKSFGVGLVVASKACVACIDTNGISGLSLIDGENFLQSETKFGGQCLDQGKRYIIEYKVLKARQQDVRINVRVDGKTIIDWTGSPRRLSLDPNHPVVKAKKDHSLWLETEEASFSISKLKLRLIGATKGQVADNRLPPETARSPSAERGTGDQASAASPQTADGTMVLFDEKTLNGWHLSEPGGPNCWSAENGELVCRPQPQSIGKNLVTDQLFRNFDLQLEFLMEDASNSGVYLRGLYEVNLNDDNASLPPPKRRCGAIIDQVAPNEQAYLGPGKWNTLNVKMVGQQVTVTMNDKRIIENGYVSGPTDHKHTLDIKEGDPGPIMLESYGSKAVRFRNIWITRIGDRLPVAASDASPAKLPVPAAVAEAYPAKSPIPAEDAQAQATKLIREIYATEYGEAKTAEKKRALAKKMIDKGVQSKEDAASQYVLFKTASDIAAQEGDYESAFQAIEQMDRLFQVDILALKARVLAKVAKATREPSQNKSVAEQAVGLIEDALAVDKVDVASELSKVALAAAGKAKDASLLKKIQPRKKDIDQIVQTAEEVQDAKKTLEEKPDDPTANLVVGKYLCFLKGKWEKGIPMLVLGSDDELKQVATKDIEGGKDAKEQVAIGDGWWDLSETKKGREAERLKERAIHWYKQAMPGLTGLAKDKVEKRLQDIQKTDERLAKAEAHAESNSRFHPTPIEALKKQLQGKTKTKQFVLKYDWKSANQLKDFDLGNAKPVLQQGTLVMRGGDSIRHLINFTEMTISVQVSVPRMQGTIIRTSGGAFIRVGGANSDTMYLGIDRDEQQFIVPQNQRSGVQPVRFTAERTHLEFEYGIGIPSRIGKAVSNVRAGQVELQGGDLGFQYGPLVITGVIDTSQSTR